MCGKIKVMCNKKFELYTGWVVDSEEKAKIKSEGIRFDNGKLRYDLIPPEVLEALAEVYTYGVKKYADRNWELGMDWMRVFASQFRHAVSWLKNESVDPESGLTHAQHALWNWAALVVYEKRKVGLDNRTCLSNPTLFNLFV